MFFSMILHGMHECPQFFCSKFASFQKYSLVQIAVTVVLSHLPELRMWLRIIPKATGIILGSYIIACATKKLACCWKRIKEKGGITFLAQCACYELVRQVNLDWLKAKIDT